MAYIKVIKDMYNGPKTRVRTVGGDTECFSIKVRLHQVSALSPFLFTIMMDELTRNKHGEVSCCILLAYSAH